MALQAIGDVTDPHRLIGADRGFAEDDRAGRRLQHGGAVPLQGLERIRDPGEQRIGTTGLGQVDIEDADLGLGHLPDLAAQSRAQKLVPEAEAEIGLGLHLDPVPDRLFLGFQPGMLGFFPDIHRPAHDPERVPIGLIGAGEIGNRLALVELDGVPLDPVRGEEVAEDAGMLDGDVLKDQETHGAILRVQGGAPQSSMPKSGPQR